MKKLIYFFYLNMIIKSLILNIDIYFSSWSKCESLQINKNSESETISCEGETHYSNTIDVKTGWLFTFTAHSTGSEVIYVQGSVTINGYKFKIQHDDDYWKKQGNKIHDISISDWYYINGNSQTGIIKF